jgi:hypothetical protein
MKNLSAPRPFVDLAGLVALLDARFLAVASQDRVSDQTVLGLLDMPLSPHSATMAFFDGVLEAVHVDRLVEDQRALLLGDGLAVFLDYVAGVVLLLDAGDHVLHVGNAAGRGLELS